MGKYSFEFKLKIVHDYLSGQGSVVSFRRGNCWQHSKLPINYK